jgi:histidine triad (HIT) family protein
LFCRIAAGEIPSKKVYEDELIYAFYDINPAAPLHFLVIPRKHIRSTADIAPEDAPLVGHIFEVIAKLASEMGYKDGFRVVSNTGDSAGQSVKHLHFHVLSGRDMTWPPG